jgi:endonuclease/exonuclease/phosphatase family metal-dependent hydrolase
MSIKRKLTAALLALNLISLCAAPSYAGNRDRSLTVMTYNMYHGTDFTDIFQAQTPEQLVAEVAEAYSDTIAGNVPERVAAIADHIEANSPTLVGLQEVALWQTGPFMDPAPATTVSVDHLQLLLDELASRGLHYAPIAIQTNLVAELPAVFGPTAALDIRFTDRVVILARTDLKTSQFKIENTEAHTFSVILPVTSPTLGTIYIPRGWTSADVKFRGKTYRFVNAHLESFYEPVQYAQAAELVQGPTNTDLPVILLGDFNSDPGSGGYAYQILMSGGFSDVWASTQPGQLGYTWPLSGEIPSDIMTPTLRLDLILARGVDLAASDIVGEEAEDITPMGFRPSDHAGLVATVVLKP